jgi:hypothetical protein
MWTIHYRPEIEDDIRSGSEWYTSKRDGLGEEFVDDYWDASIKLGIDLCRLQLPPMDCARVAFRGFHISYISESSIGRF